MPRVIFKLLREVEGGVTAPCGFEAAGVRCGLKQHGPDLALLYSVAPAVGAGVFTTNLVKAAPVLLSQDRVGHGPLHSVLVNAGNANACTGTQGYLDAVHSAALVAEELAVPESSVLVCSTGVIGHRLPMKLLEEGIPKAVAELGPHGGPAAATAILTTDTQPKTIAVEFELAGRPVRVGGMAKGSGMIAPNLATMLAFLTTDAELPQELLQSCLAASVERSFNRITVDGDTSTNDTVLLLANRLAEAGPITPRRGLARFQAALDYVTAHLAHALVTDGEGASRVAAIHVRGALSEPDALQLAHTIANSPLVKTALAGGDPNWGRVLAAAGRAGVPFDPDRTELFLGDVRVMAAGAACRFDPAAAEKAVRRPEVNILLDLHLGEGEATVWTCDLTAEYVKINADYHT